MEPLNVASLLHSLGLGKYAITFQAEEVSNILLPNVCIFLHRNDLSQA